MSKTPRKHRLQVPLFTRASDLQGLHECGARWILNYLHEPDLPETGWFALGDACHAAIEHVIKEDSGLKPALKVGRQVLIERLLETDREVMWSKSSRAKRTEESVFDDLKRLMENWWEDVHPSSEKRWPLYDEYQWPPEAEHVFVAPPVGVRKYPLRSEVDSIWHHKFDDTDAIVDWKSGSTAKAKDIQLWTYHYGLLAAGDDTYHGVEDKVVGWFHHMEARKPQHAMDYPGHAYISQAIRWAEEQKEAQLFVAVPDWWCDYCRTREYCPVFQGATALEGINDLLAQVEWLDTPLELADTSATEVADG